jgi:hypothetical protein
VMKRSYAKDQRARVGHRERFAWPRGARIDSKELWALPGTFMDVRFHPGLGEGS